MITLRPSSERGSFNFGWLDTKHSFSFGDYHDPAHMSFHALRVINEDVVAPGKGFPPHPHRDMEIFTYVLSGALAHKDSTGGEGVIRPGDVQRMSAGSGVVHSEFNHSSTEPVHLLQVWLRPLERSLDPSYEQKHFPLEARRGRLTPILSADRREGSLLINQDATVYSGVLPPGHDAISYVLPPSRAAWVQLIRGSLDVNGTRLSAGDGAAIENETELRLQNPGADEAEFLFFDLA